LLLGENEQTDEAVKMPSRAANQIRCDRDTYLNIAQVYERARRFKEAGRGCARR